MPALWLNTPMRRVSDILNRTYKGFGRIVKVRTLWKEIAGEVLGSHSEPVQLKGKTLWVLCDSPAWVQQVDILSPSLVPRLRQMAGVKVEKISARFAAKSPSQPGKPGGARAARRRPGKPDIDPADVDRITNPELRKAVKALLEG